MSFHKERFYVLTKLAIITNYAKKPVFSSAKGILIEK